MQQTDGCHKVMLRTARTKNSSAEEAESELFARLQQQADEQHSTYSVQSRTLKSSDGISGFQVTVAFMEMKKQITWLIWRSDTGQ